MNHLILVGFDIQSKATFLSLFETIVNPSAVFFPCPQIEESITSTQFLNYTLHFIPPNFYTEICRQVNLLRIRHPEAIWVIHTPLDYSDTLLSQYEIALKVILSSYNLPLHRVEVINLENVQLIINESNKHELNHVIFNETDERSSIWNIENTERRLFHINALFLNIPQVSRVLAQHPEMMNFEKNLLSPIQQFVKINRTQIEFILGALEKFIKDFLIKKLEHGVWIGHSRYFHKEYEADNIIPSSSGGGRSFLLFTRSSKPEKYYVLMKSNIKMIEAHGADLNGNHLWAQGNEKRVKLYAILFTFSVDNQNIIPDPVSPVEHVTTFTEPIVQRFGVEQFFNKNVLSKQYKQDRKSHHMEVLLGHYISPRIKKDFGVVISFFDPTINIKRVIAYQSYAGKTLRHMMLLHQCDLWSFEQRIHSILSFLEDVKRIVCEEKTWPNDIKPENICVKESLIFPGFFDIKLIDYITRKCTRTFLDIGEPNRSPNRTIGYSHPCHAVKTELSLVKYLLYCRLLDNVHLNQKHFSPRSRAFQLIAYHLCFEMILLIYTLVHNSLFSHNDDLYPLFSWGRKFFTHTELSSVISPFIQPMEVERTLFYDTLVKYTYGQTFDHTISVDEILRPFFISIRTELVIRGNYCSPQYGHLTPLGDKNKVLSDEWIADFASQFMTLVRAQAQPLVPAIEELQEL